MWRVFRKPEGGGACGMWESKSSDVSHREQGGCSPKQAPSGMFPESLPQLAGFSELEIVTGTSESVASILKKRHHFSEAKVHKIKSYLLSKCLFSVNLLDRNRAVCWSNHCHQASVALNHGNRAWTRADPLYRDSASTTLIRKAIWLLCNIQVYTQGPHDHQSYGKDYWIYWPEVNNIDILLVLSIFLKPPLGDFFFNEILCVVFLYITFDH